MSDKASVFDTASARILSLASEFVTPRKAESVFELGPLEGGAFSDCEVGLCAVPGSPIEGAKIIDGKFVRSCPLPPSLPAGGKFVRFRPLPPCLPVGFPFGIEDSLGASRDRRSGGLLRARGMCE